MSILSIRPKAFRSRNPGRDAETDAVRAETIRNAIIMALSDVRRERDGLVQRMEMHHARAASILDHSGDYGSRTREDETAIRSSESGAVNARRRLSELDAQIEKFGRLLAELDGTTAEVRGLTGA
ncbi:hypothetical protein IC608_07010 [Devosia sp. PTR5]|jgi:hypothetical protein|uniref:Uncharacterized protein n=1 Tax=Devosia oryzisoli TaxID=2774138 RepID=A0A927FTS1_9HYPH|nr:hypothetical protein [Devosia oryzisoli]MBD8065217.1 hypothetical protein [Devosia oryzisoli]